MTHLLRSLLNRNLFALAAFTAAVAPQALKADNANCQVGNSIMNGTYYVSATGTIAGTGVGTGPVVYLGLVSYDGDGHGLYGPSTTVVNGVASTDPGGTKGTFTVNRDCTGFKQFADGTHYNFVITPDGNTITWIETDSGGTIIGVATRLKK
jgi:hypothetical protein